jgi:hypothetical protein
LVREYRAELLKYHAISRIGRSLIIFADHYDVFLKSGSVNVDGFRELKNEEKPAPEAKRRSAST